MANNDRRRFKDERTRSREMEVLGQDLRKAVVKFEA